MTDRELYLFVSRLETTYKNAPNRSLEAYLSALWKLVSTERPETPTLEQFVQWIEAAFHEEAPPFDPQWLAIPRDYGRNFTTCDDFVNLLLSQIADLHRMKEAGAIKNQYHNDSVRSPTGETWANLDPFSYLDGAIAGKYGGYKTREIIEITSPSEAKWADAPVYEITSFTWKDFAEILKLGQWYE